MDAKQGFLNDLRDLHTANIVDQSTYDRVVLHFESHSLSKQQTTWFYESDIFSIIYDVLEERVVEKD